MPQVTDIKEVKLRLFTRAPQRYLKDLPFILVIKDKRILVSEEMSTKLNVDKKVSDNPNLPTKNKMSDNIDMPKKILNKIPSTHACGCKINDSKLCKAHGRF